MAVHAMLAEVDPAAAEATHPNNVKRVIRALEIYHTTGMTKTELDRRSQEAETDYDALVIGIRFPDTEALYRRINLRVDLMLEQGLVEECRTRFGGEPSGAASCQTVSAEQHERHFRCGAGRSVCIDRQGAYCRAVGPAHSAHGCGTGSTDSEKQQG